MKDDDEGGDEGCGEGCCEGGDEEFIIEGTCFGTKVRSITSYTKSARVANSEGKNQYM